MKRNEVIQIRVSQAEKTHLTALATARKTTVSEMLREGAMHNGRACGEKAMHNPSEGKSHE